VIKVRLREMMAAHRARTGERLTYAELAERAELATATIESLASREGYNASLATIERICRALGCGPGELLAMDPPIEEGPPCP
jgi:DNA-binding Xre family transcriptional regulator